MLGDEKDTENPSVLLLNPDERSTYRNKYRGFWPKGILRQHSITRQTTRDFREFFKNLPRLMTERQNKKNKKKKIYEKNVLSVAPIVMNSWRILRLYRNNLNENVREYNKIL